MFSRVAAAAFLALPLLAAATPVDLEARQSVCSIGSLQCCNSVMDPNSSAAQVFLGLLGVVLEPLDALIGVTCSPIVSVAGGSSCDASPVCCTDNSSYDFISLGCLPISL